MASPRDPDPEDRQVIEITPDPGTKIEALAPQVIKLMKELDLEAEIHFPTFTLEVPKGATAKDIVDAYNSVVIDYLPDVRPAYKPPPKRGPNL